MKDRLFYKPLRSLLALSFVLLSGCAGSLGTGTLFNVRESGAVGDGKTKDTTAIQSALDRCAAAGGGHRRRARREITSSAASR